MSSIHRFQSHWRSITFNQHLNNGTDPSDPANLNEAQIALGYYQLDVVDINRVSVQDYRELKQFLEGAEPNESFEGVRAINASGRIIGTSAADLEDKAWALNEAFAVSAVRVAAQSVIPKGVLPYTFRRASVAGTKLLRFYCRPGPGRPVWVGRHGEGFGRPFSFQLIAFDSFAYDDDDVDTDWLGNPTVVTNPGNVYTRPSIVFTFSAAGASNFTLQNTTTGKTLGLDLSGMAAGQTLTIDPARGTIVRDNGADMYSIRTAGFITDLFLIAGGNSIVISNATGISLLRFQVRGAYA